MNVTRKKDVIVTIKVWLTKVYVTEFQLCFSVYDLLEKNIPIGREPFFCVTRHNYTTCQVFTNKELTKFLAHLSGILQCSHQAAALRDSRKKKLKWRIKTKKMRPLGRRGKLRVKRT